MPTKATQKRSQAPRATGVAAPPAGWSVAAWWGLVAGLVLLFALLFALAAESFGVAFDRLDRRVGLEGGASGEPFEAAASGSPGADSPESEAAGAASRIEEPREPAWTLLDVEGAVHAMGPQIEALVEEGRDELPEFEALASRDATRAARARERWTAWARIWRNRVGRLGAQLPPPVACSVHAAMDPACRSLRSILAQLESVAETEDLELAQERLEETATALDLFLNPPEPEPEDEEAEEGETEDGETEGGETEDGAEGQQESARDG